MSNQSCEGECWIKLKKGGGYCMNGLVVRNGRCVSPGQRETGLDMRNAGTESRSFQANQEAAGTASILGGDQGDHYSGQGHN